MIRNVYVTGIYDYLKEKNRAHFSKKGKKELNPIQANLMRVKDDDFLQQD